MDFIRFGTTTPNDFVDLTMRRRFSDYTEHESETPKAKLRTLFDKSTERIEVKTEQGVIISTPLIKREYLVAGKRIDVGVGIGHTEHDAELGIVIEVEGETHVLAVPENGIEGVPGTHGVDELLDWIDSLYPELYS